MNCRRMKISGVDATITPWATRWNGSVSSRIEIRKPAPEQKLEAIKHLHRADLAIEKYVTDRGVHIIVTPTQGMEVLMDLAESVIETLNCPA